MSKDLKNLKIGETFEMFQKYKDFTVETLFTFFQFEERLKIILYNNNNTKLNIIHNKEKEEVKQVDAKEEYLLDNIYRLIHELFVLLKTIGIEKTRVLDFFPKNLFIDLTNTHSKIIGDIDLQNLEILINQSDYVSKIPNYRIFFTLISLFKNIPSISKLISTLNYRKYDIQHCVYDSIYDGYILSLLSQLDKEKSRPSFKRDIFEKFFLFLSNQIEHLVKFKYINAPYNVFKKFLMEE
jgi:hypothetical protein